MSLSDLGQPLGNVTPWRDEMWPIFTKRTLELLFDGWNAMLADGYLQGSWLENQFSTALHIHLLRLRDTRDDLRVFSFRDEARILDEQGILTGQVNPDTSPRVEIIVRHAGMARQPHLACEAKVITATNTGTRRAGKLIRAYVDEGMRRFVEERYGAGGTVGIMLGVVLIGPTDRIASTIRKAVVRRKLPCHRNLYLVSADAVCPGHYQSTHPRPTRGPITLEHLLLPIN